MNRRKLLGFFSIIPFLTFSNTQAKSIENKSSNDPVEWGYIGVFEWTNSEKCLAEIRVNKKFIHRPDVIAMACTRILQECYCDKILIKTPRFKFSKTPFQMNGDLSLQFLS